MQADDSQPKTLDIPDLESEFDALKKPDLSILEKIQKITIVLYLKRKLITQKDFLDLALPYLKRIKGIDGKLVDFVTEDKKYQNVAGKEAYLFLLSKYKLTNPLINPNEISFVFFLSFLLEAFNIKEDLVIVDVFQEYGLHPGNIARLVHEIKRLQNLTNSSKAIAFWIFKNLLHINSDDTVQVDTTLALKGFAINYQDKNHSLKHFVDFVRQNIIDQFNDMISDDSYYYALFFAVVQSSGYGKSRMLLEAGKKHLNTVYGCVRTDDTANGIPSSNLNLRDFLQNNNSVESLKLFLVTCYYVAFNHVVKAKRSKDDDLPLNTFLSSDSSHFFKKYWDLVIETYKNPPRENLLTWFSKTQSEFSDLRTKYKPIDGMLNGKMPSELLIVFDEAKSLLRPNLDNLNPNDPSHDMESSIFRNLRRALRLIDSRNMVLVFTDTLSSISNFAPASSFDSSYRPGKQFHLLPPYYELLTYDSVRKYLDAIGDAINDFDCAAHYGAVFSQGRPLWKALYLNEGISAKELEQLVLFARRKLVNSQTLDLSNDVAKIALVAVRCGIKGVLDHHLGSTLMSSYMGTGIYIDDDRIRMVVEYPVEPILGEAACQNLHFKIIDKKAERFKFSLNYKKIQSFLMTFISRCISGLVSAGEIGEIIARCILSLTYDSVVIKRSKGHKGHLPPPLLFSRPVAVKDFILALVSPEYIAFFKEHFGAFPPVLSSQFLATFGKGIICFTSWLALEDLKLGMTAEEWQPYLKKWFYSRIAIIMPLNQKGTDFLIPVKLGDLYSFILVQVKNRVKIQSERLEVSGEKLTPINSFNKEFYPGLETIFVGKKRKHNISCDKTTNDVTDEAMIDQMKRLEVSGKKLIPSKSDEECQSSLEKKKEQSCNSGVINDNVHASSRDVNVGQETTDEDYDMETDSSARSDHSQSSTDEYVDNSPNSTNTLPQNDTKTPVASSEIVEDVPLSALFPQYMSIYFEIGPESLADTLGTISKDRMASQIHSFPNHLLLLGFESTTISNHPDLSTVFKLFCRRHIENVDLYDRLVELKAMNSYKFEFSKAPGCSCQGDCSTRRCGCRKQGKACTDFCYCSLEKSECTNCS